MITSDVNPTEVAMQPILGRYFPHLQNISNEADIGRDCIIHCFVWIGAGVKMGERCKVQAFTFIPNGVTIGNDVFIGPHVCFTNDVHPKVECYGEMAETIVEDHANIGANATIIAGVRIGAGATIGAGAVVTKDVPPGETWVGNPARRIRKDKPVQNEVGC